MPIRMITSVPSPASGTRRENTIDRPIDAAIEESASRIGTPAASTAPNTTSRITNVTGRVISSDSARSLPRWVSLPAPIEALPVSRTVRPGKSRPTAAVVFNSAVISFGLDAATASPFMLTRTSIAWWFVASAGAVTEETCGSARIRCASSFPAATACPWSSGPERLAISTRSTAGTGIPASSAMASAVPASPTR